MSSVAAALGPIGLGTFPFSGMLGAIDDTRAGAVLDRFISSGGRYVETAPSYQTGEVDLGALLRNWSREAFLVGTKCGTARDGAGLTFTSGRRDHILRQHDDELRRLGLEWLDVVQLHHLPQDGSAAEAMEVLAELRDQGLIRWIGVSNVARRELERLHTVCKVDIVQNRLSLIHDGGHPELAPYCADNDIVLNVYQVIERGQLAGRGPATPRTGDDLRRSKPEYSGAADNVVRRWHAAHVLPLAARHGVTPEHLAIGWALAQAQVACCVLGATDPGQVERNLAASTQLNASVLGDLRAAREHLAREIARDHDMGIEAFRGLAGQADSH